VAQDCELKVGTAMRGRDWISAAAFELTIAFDWHLIGALIPAMDENSKAQTKSISSE
jgi:hypothetical protein